MTKRTTTRGERKNYWTRDEHVLAFNLYCQIPFGKCDEDTPQVQELARLLGRSKGSVSFKLNNFARLDPALQARGVKGLSHGAKGEGEVWKEFAERPEDLALESEHLLARWLGKSLEEVADIETRDLPKEGLERDAVVRVRVNQSFFRRRILSAYNYQCCVTGLAVQPLLSASHILPWSVDKANRLNPKNGLCLNALHDRVFDRQLMWIEPDFTIRFSARLAESSTPSNQTIKWLISFEGEKLKLPRKFSPEPDFLKCHAEGCKKAV